MAVDPTKLDSQKSEASLPYDKNNKPIHALMLPIVDTATSKITGWIPLAFDVDADGKAILHVKVIP